MNGLTDAAEHSYRINNSITRSGMQIDMQVTLVIILLFYNVVHGRHSANPLNVNGNVFARRNTLHAVQNNGAGHRKTFRSLNNSSLTHF